jgi:hypothetical protein
VYFISESSVIEIRRLANFCGGSHIMQSSEIYVLKDRYAIPVNVFFLEPKITTWLPREIYIQFSV